MLTRRQLLKRSAAGGAVAMVPGAVMARPAEARVVIPRLWAAACPTPGASWPVIPLTGGGGTTLSPKEFKVSVHPDLPATRVWGYLGPGEAPDGQGLVPGRSTYLGPTLVASRGTPVNVQFTNNLPAPLFPADPALLPPGAVDSRINTHQHGGRVRDTEDGNPFDAYSAGGKPEVAPGDSQTQSYPNEQWGTLLWYHDHALGITRTNVYAGLAGGYLLTEPEVQQVTVSGGDPAVDTFTLTFEDRTTAAIGYGATAAAVEAALEAFLAPADVAVSGADGGPYTVSFASYLGNVPELSGVGTNAVAVTVTTTIPAGAQAVNGVPTAFDLSDVPDPYNPAGKIPLHIPLVIQDKDIDDLGQLVYPFPWAPEFFGTSCLVNGRAFPYLQVQPRVYRFTFLNGSQSRFYNLTLNKRNVPITQIGVELGPTAAAAPINSILIGPAERADVIVDFSQLRVGDKAVLVDVPLPPGVISPTRPLADCMQFRVVGPALTGPDPFAGAPVMPGWTANSPTPRPQAGDVGDKRYLVTLEEVLGRGGKPMMAVVNGTPFMERDNAGMMTHNPSAPWSTEKVTDGATVEWDYLNLTADSHPFHTHLAHFEVVKRWTFNAVQYLADLTQARGPAWVPGQPGAAANIGLGPAPATYDPKDYADPFTAANMIRYAVTEKPAAPGVPAGGVPPQEQGPKDTVIANPGEITRIRLKFDLPTGTPPGDYQFVFHCHILEHEENEMMRPLLVTKPSA